MKLRLLIAAFIMVGFTSCAQRIMCPTYAIDETQEMRIPATGQESM